MPSSVRSKSASLSAFDLVRSALAGLGDLVPPAAMAARFSAQTAGEKSLAPTLRACAVPALALFAWSLAVLLASPVLERIL